MYPQVGRICEDLEYIVSTLRWLEDAREAAERGLTPRVPELSLGELLELEEMVARWGHRLGRMEERLTANVDNPIG
jgi:hypothetical protein